MGACVVLGAHVGQPQQAPSPRRQHSPAPWALRLHGAKGCREPDEDKLIAESDLLRVAVFAETAQHQRRRGWQPPPPALMYHVALFLQASEALTFLDSNDLDQEQPLGLSATSAGEIFVCAGDCVRRFVRAPFEVSGSWLSDTVVKSGHCLNARSIFVLEDEQGYASAIYLPDRRQHQVLCWLVEEDRIQPEGEVVAGGNGKGMALNQLQSPRWVFVTQGGAKVFVSDSNNHRIVLWTPNGSTRQGEVVAGGYGAGGAPHQLNFPAGFTVLQDDDLLICDSHNHRVVLWKRGANTGAVIADCQDDTFPESIAYYPDTHDFVLAEHSERRIVLWHKGADTAVPVACCRGKVREAYELFFAMAVCAVPGTDLLLFSDTCKGRIQLALLQEEEFPPPRSATTSHLSRRSLSSVLPIMDCSEDLRI
eukprot:TRINITY_DN12604_c0_g1_i1.p1 TRINITY_DN12604_c0_g1~~TRINITY_DN12604_c0_g1_i1.p1  ORF type:complete len:422 (+),score=53.39 TRINITY_DN12604_c0_g1_i1:1372-2637(+)